MNKSHRPSRPSRPTSKPSINRSSRPGGIHIGGGMNKPSSPSGGFTPHPSGMNPQPVHTPDAFDQSKKGPGFTGQEHSTINQGYGQQHSTINQPYGQQYGRPRRRWGTPVIIIVAIVACCLILLCIAGIYYAVSQGLINFQ